MSASCTKLLYVNYIYIKNTLLKPKDRGFSKTSVFGKSTLDLTEKPAIWAVFRKPLTKLTEFWKRLNQLNLNKNPGFVNRPTGKIIVSLPAYFSINSCQTLNCRGKIQFRAPYKPVSGNKGLTQKA